MIELLTLAGILAGVWVINRRFPVLARPENEDDPVLGATPLPHRERVATRWRAQLVSRVVSRHRGDTDAAGEDSGADTGPGPDGGDPEAPPSGHCETCGQHVTPVTRVADGVHASGDSSLVRLPGGGIDTWTRAALEHAATSGRSDADVAKECARTHRVSLRTAQRAVARARERTQQ